MSGVLSRRAHRGHGRNNCEFDIDSGYAPFRWRSVSQVSKLEFGHGALLAVGLVPRPSTLRVWASARAGVRLT